MTTSTHAELLINLINLNAKIQRLLSGPLSCHGISLTEYLVLRQLKRAPNLKMRRIDLAQAVGLSASGITRLLNPMQKIGLVAKEEAARDARVSLVGLTEAGEKILADAETSFDNVAQSLLGSLDDDRQNSLFEITGSLSRTP